VKFFDLSDLTDSTDLADENKQTTKTMNDNQQTKEARHLLRTNIQRLARMRTEKRFVPARHAWPERQLLWSLVHGLVCATNGYDPALDAQVQWASWFLRVCEDYGKITMPFVNEEAVLFLILEMPVATTRRDAACGE
jgi:hypothetical protein